MHPLDWPRAKVKRAKSQVIALQASLERFFKENTYSIILADFNRKAGYQYVRIKDAPTLPDEWGVVIGEIVHNLRSALDLLAWQLALKDTPEPYGRTAFPIYLIGHTDRRDRNGNIIPQFWHTGHGLRLLKSIHRRYRTRIEAFQPYKRGNRGRQSPIFLLQELNNTDKHRLITVLGTWAVGTSFQGRIGGGSKFKVGVPLYPNAIIGYVYPLKNDALILDFSNGRPQIKKTREIEVNLEITPGIRFADGGKAVQGFPVIPTLNSLLNEVSRIIESFANDF